MKVRRALPADAAALAALEQQQPRAAGWGKDGFVAELAQPCAWIGCAEQQGEIVGFLALRCAAGCAEILNVAVAPHHTRQGIGRALLQQALAALRAQAAEQVSLEVAQDNVPAQALYAQAGLKPLGRRKDFYGPGCDGLIMGMNL